MLLALDRAACPDEAIPSGVLRRLQAARKTLALAGSSVSDARSRRLIRRTLKLLQLAGLTIAEAEQAGTLSHECAAALYAAIADTGLVVDRWFQVVKPKR
jgi:hypothetical protein